MTWSAPNFLAAGKPARDGIETDDAARAARFGHRRAVEAEQAKALDDDGVAQRNFGGFRHRCHGGDAAIERRRFLVAQFVGEFQNPGAGQDVAIFGKAAEKMRVFLRKVVAVFAHAVALLRHVEHFAVVALAVEEIFAPGDAIADLQRIAAHVLFDACAEFLDDADDLVAENARARIGPASLVGMDIGAADRRHRHPHQNFAAFDRAQRKFLHDERRVRCFVNGGLGGAHVWLMDSLVDMTDSWRSWACHRRMAAACYSTPFSAKSKIS